MIEQMIPTIQARAAHPGERPESLFRWFRWGWLPMVLGCIAIALLVLVGWELYDAASPDRLPFLARSLLTAILIAIWVGFYVLYARRRILAVYHRLRREELALFERGLRAEQSFGMGALSRILAHEIRNPLNGMSLNGALLRRRLEKLDGGEELIPLVDILASETSRLGHLVDDYLAYTQAKRIELACEPLDVGALAQDFIATQQPAFEAAATHVSVHTKEGLPLARADASKLRQVLHNLLRNAMEAMPHGGDVRIDIGKDDQAVVLSIQDSGPGFESAESVLRPFYTTKADGSGLGLAIVRDIIRAHGGEIDARNLGPEGGAEIVMRIPFQEAPR